MNSDYGSEGAPDVRADDECRVIMDSIRRIVQLLRRSATAAEKSHGLSAAQLFVLHKLADGHSLSIGDLAERTLTSQSSVSEVVQKLVSNGCVTRVRSQRDARSVELSLTDDGRKILEKAPVAPQDYILAGLNRMPPRDRKQLARLLARLVKETGMINVAVRPRMIFEENGDSAPASDAAESPQV